MSDQDSNKRGGMMRIEPCVACGDEMVLDENTSITSGKKVYVCVSCRKQRSEYISGSPLEIREINETVEVGE